MFPYSSSPYPSFPSSSSSFPLFPFLNPENASASNNTLLHDPLSVPYIPTHHHSIPIPETLTNLAIAADNNCAVAMPKHDPASGGGAPHYGISCLLTKKPAKKDRHSKIYTSQGLRDRRVRLSIEIARKFFDLQDMLGFDKASNTLEWLFSKSKKAIKELAKSKHSNNNSDSSSECDDCEVVSGIKQHQDTPNLQQQQQGLLDSKDESLMGAGGGDAAKERKLKRAQKEPACVRANKMKESREKARARARERTSNKMCSTNSNSNNNNNNNTGRVQQLELKKKFPAAIENPQILHQSRSQVQPDQDCVRSPNKLVHPHPHPHHHLVGSEAPRDDFNVIEESIVIKRKLKPSLMASHHHHHHQNLVIPKEASFNNSDYHSFPNLSPNWDANNGSSTGRSNFCAIASMNLSTGLQIFGKSWEECTNPRLH